MGLLIPAGKRYVASGTLGTQAARREAMVTFRDAAWQKLTNYDPAGNPVRQHYLDNHWHLEDD